MKNQVEKGMPEKPEHEIYIATLAQMPKHSKAAPKAKLMYTNGHFAYASIPLQSLPTDSVSSETLCSSKAKRILLL